MKIRNKEGRERGKEGRKEGKQLPAFEKTTGQESCMYPTIPLVWEVREEFIF
jgi:hypothetical protein